MQKGESQCISQGFNKWHKCNTVHNLGKLEEKVNRQKVATNNKHFRKGLVSHHPQCRVFKKQEEEPLFDHRSIIACQRNDNLLDGINLKEESPIEWYERKATTIQ